MLITVVSLIKVIGDHAVPRFARPHLLIPAFRWLLRGFLFPPSPKGEFPPTAPSGGYVAALPGESVGMRITHSNFMIVAANVVAATALLCGDTPHPVRLARVELMLRWGYFLSFASRF